MDSELYVRAYNGKRSKWHQAAMKQKAGKIVAAGMTRQVHFEPVTGEVNRRIDEAYQKKYKGSQYVQAMMSDRAREATVRIR